jgi:hypothetical protein
VIAIYIVRIARGIVLSVVVGTLLFAPLMVTIVTVLVLAVAAAVICDSSKTDQCVDAGSMLLLAAAM